jgi:hypothetical protein
MFSLNIPESLSNWLGRTNIFKKNITCSYGKLGRNNENMCKINENVDSRIAKFKFLCMYF